ncbi:hypothetical protein [Bradyrhizobium sp. SZCCHNPS1003]|uniref:hypothetical protein n=1 Tax=Bradyrhizobium sp. SZCCHNPS1003 TaxID=3057330 RepID=UPI0028E575C6|nr:hypothetical protein [Bradyrhizobium sp. SZCCHNPS1003]
MTATNTSQKDLIAFLDWLAGKGMMNAQTAASRKAAVNTLLSALDADETADVTKLNLDDVARRFMNKRPGEVKPDSVKVYKSRVQSAIADFKSYRADPLNFRVALVPKPSNVRAEKATTQPIAPSPIATSAAVHQGAPTHHVFVSPSEIEIVVPIPIRANTIVKIVGLPSDLTKQEAAKLANVIQAFATVDEPKDSP